MNDTRRPNASDVPAPDEAVAVPSSTEGVITVALIEDNRLVREGITSVLNRLGDIEVLASPPDGHEAFLDRVSPQVILLDVGLEGRDSLEVAQRITREFPGAGIIVMDLLPAADDIVEFISLGVSGFIMKDATIEEVARTIRAVAAGVDILPEAMTATLFSEIAREAAAEGGTRYHDAVQLTPREQAVIELIAEGMSNKAVGSRLHISIHTVKSHLRNIMEKLNLHSRLELARYVDDAEEDEPRRSDRPA